MTEYMYIETLNIEAAENAIRDICNDNDMDYRHDGVSDFGTPIYRVPEDFPINAIDSEGWFLGYDIKEGFD